jgi:radical SAM protein with 4Fe4S-binding SPASM domain
MPFCYSPWTNIDISPDGNLSPCCKYQFNEGEKRFNIKHNTIEEYKNSDVLNNIKQAFDRQEWPHGCDRCRIEEQNNIKSKRQLDYERWQQYYDQCDLALTGFITASIAFGNTCNLTCITCGPHASSRWQREYETI